MYQNRDTMNNPRSVSPMVSPPNPDLSETQRQASCGEFSRLEKRIGARKMTFHSKSMPRGAMFLDQEASRNFHDKRYDLFRTMSGKLERQISNLRGKPNESSLLQDHKEITESLTADRYFDALQGPELETLKVLYCSFLLDLFFFWLLPLDLRIGEYNRTRRR